MAALGKGARTDDGVRNRGIAVLMQEKCEAGNTIDLVLRDGTVHTGTFKREVESPDWIVMGHDELWIRLEDVRRWRITPQQ